MPADWIKGARRLVEDTEIGVPEQRHAEAEPLLHPLRETPYPVVAPIRQPDRRERLADESGHRPLGSFRSRQWRTRTSRADSHPWKRNSSGR